MYFANHAELEHIDIHERNKLFRTGIEELRIRIMITIESKLHDTEVKDFILRRIDDLIDTHTQNILDEDNFETSNELIIDIHISILASFLSFMLASLEEIYSEKRKKDSDFAKKEIMLDDIMVHIKNSWHKKH